MAMERAAEAAREGDLQYISGIAPEELIRLCSKKDEDGRTLLHAAAASGSLPLLQYLLDRGGAAGTVNSSDEEVGGVVALCRGGHSWAQIPESGEWRQESGPASPPPRISPPRSRRAGRRCSRL